MCHGAQTYVWELYESGYHETCSHETHLEENDLEMSVSTPLRARHLLTFLLLASAPVRSLSCDAQPDLPSVVGSAFAVDQSMDGNPDRMPPSRLPGVLRSVSAVLDPRVASALSSNTIPLGLRN
jgi:hypothetical protein